MKITNQYMGPSMPHPNKCLLSLLFFISKMLIKLISVQYLLVYSLHFYLFINMIIQKKNGI